MMRTDARRQRGAIAILTGFTIAVLIGFLGISVDLGRLFVAKAELQTAMDACALAAASGLRPGLSDPDSMNRARAWGKAPSDAGMRSILDVDRGESVNQVQFQRANLDSSRIEFEFGSRLDNISAAWTDNNTARYARCSYPLDGIAVYFMRMVGGATSKGVRAMATATMGASSGPVCTFPLVMCNKGGVTTSAGRWGLTIGEWQQAVDQGASEVLGPGKFGWANLDGGPGSNAELKGWIEGEGYCGPVSNDLTSGAQQGSATSWNSRFGLYKNGAGNPQPDTARPDFTGYAYGTNWSANPLGVNNAYQGTDLAAAGGPNEPNYGAAAASNLPYQGNIPGFNQKLTSAELNNGENRRIVPVPVVDCTSATPAPLTRLGLACVLLLRPITDPKDASIEFLGRADEVTSCRSSGAAGGTGGGTFVPVLVQ